MVVGVPWKKNEDDKNADGEEMKTEVIVMDKEYKERMVEKGERHEKVPRRVYLQKDDFERWGYTSGCPGCASILKGTTRQMHTEACRTRMEKEMTGEGRMLEAERRRDEYLEKAIARDEAKRQKRKNDENEQDGSNTGGSSSSTDVKKDNGDVEMNKDE